MATVFYDRKNPRLKEYDYGTPGFYFVTMNAKHRGEDVFCHISLNVGVGAAHLGGPSPDTEIPFDFLMDNVVTTLTDVGEIVKQLINGIENVYPHVRLDTYVIMPDHIHMILAIEDTPHGPPRCAAPTETLPHIINVLKSMCSRKVGTPIWQRSFYDRVIRTHEELNAYRAYIEQNPARWIVKHPKGDTHA